MAIDQHAELRSEEEMLVNRTWRRLARTSQNALKASGAGFFEKTARAGEPRVVQDL